MKLTENQKSFEYYISIIYKCIADSGRNTKPNLHNVGTLCSCYVILWYTLQSTLLFEKKLSALN